MKRVAIYVRVSTGKQELRNQILDLKEYVKHQGWQIHEIYTDIVTGKEVKEEKRPGFQKLFLDAHKKKFNIVLFWDLSRFSRAGTLYTLQKLQELRNLKIDFVSYNEPYISSLGQFADIVISIMSTIAKLEREKISERTKAGLRRAIKEGKKVGRPRYAEQLYEAVIKDLKEKELGIRAIARKHKISTGYIYGVIKRGIKTVRRREV